MAVCDAESGVSRLSHPLSSIKFLYFILEGVRGNLEAGGVRGAEASLSVPVCYHRFCCLFFGGESELGMTARILDGTKIRDQIFTELKDEVRLLTSAGAPHPSVR